MAARKTLLTADSVVTTDAENRVVRRCGVVVEGSRIAAVAGAKTLAAARLDATPPGLDARAEIPSDSA